MSTTAANNPIIDRIHKALAARDKAQKALNEHHEKRLKKGSQSSDGAS